MAPTLRQNGPVPRRVSLWARAVEAGEGRATLHGEVWLGPILVGDCFTAASRADNADVVRLTLVAMTAPAEAQEVGRVPRVTALVAGDGVDLLRAGDVLLGEVDRSSVHPSIRSRS
jgi:hypothetical protein